MEGFFLEDTAVAHEKEHVKEEIKVDGAKVEEGRDQSPPLQSAVRGLLVLGTWQRPDDN